jgi:hypothetical protein
MKLFAKGCSILWLSIECDELEIHNFSNGQNILLGSKRNILLWKCLHNYCRQICHFESISIPLKNEKIVKFLFIMFYVCFSWILHIH